MDENFEMKIYGQMRSTGRKQFETSIKKWQTIIAGEIRAFFFLVNNLSVSFIFLYFLRLVSFLFVFAVDSVILVKNSTMSFLIDEFCENISFWRGMRDVENWMVSLSDFVEIKTPLNGILRGKIFQLFFVIFACPFFILSDITEWGSSKQKK